MKTKFIQTTFQLRGINLLLITIFTSFSVFSQNQQNALNSTGNVGVGTISPDSKLQVNGSMSIDSSLTVRDTAIFEKQARMKDKIIVEGDAVIKGKLTARDDLKVVGTTKIEGPLKLTNLPNAQATDTTLLFVNANGKVKAAGPSALMGIMYPNPAEIDPCPFGVFNNRPIWFSKPNILWTGDPCPENTSVGINTNAPVSTLDVLGNGHFSTDLTIGDASLNSFGKVHIKNIDRAATLSINAVGNTNNYHKLLFLQYDATAQNTEIINATKVGASKPTFLVAGDGSFYFYNGTKKTLQMDADGLLHGRRIIVDQATWPDYVFKKEYSLMTLSELAYYIHINGHLPNVPTETNVQENGIDLGEMNKTLLQKVEELTLYVIQQQKEIEELKLKMEQIEKR